MERLKPCPFCGTPVTMIYNSLSNAFMIYHTGNDDPNCCIIEPIMLEAVSLADARQKSRDTASYINEGYHKRARKIGRRSK